MRVRDTGNRATTIRSLFAAFCNWRTRSLPGIFCGVCLIRTRLSPVSSREFSVSLRPTQRLRNRVKLFAAVCAVAGAMLIFRLSVPWLIRAVALVAWLAFSFYELYRYSRSARGIRRIRLNQLGQVTIFDPQGRDVPSRLLPGSLITGSLAWLRFSLPNGRIFGELLCRNEVQEADWHRLQLLWQQGRPFIGGANVS